MLHAVPLSHANMNGDLVGPVPRVRAFLEWSVICNDQCNLQGKLDVSDEQKIALDKALRKYRSELHALAAERMSLNAVLAKAAVPGKSDSVQKVCSTLSLLPPWQRLPCLPC